MRAFNFVDYPPVIHPVDIYAAPAAARVVRKDYDYAFEEENRGAPDIRLHEIDVARPLEIAGERIVPVSGHHSERFEVTGYRIGRMAYLTDFKTIADAEVGKLIGVELLVVNALRFRPHPSHFNVGRRWHSSPGSRLAGRLSRMCRTRSDGTRRRRLFCRGGRTGLRRIGNHNLKIWIFLKGKTVVVTGASSGIGRALAEYFAAAGANAVLGARHEDALREIVGRIGAAGGHAAYAVCDVTREADCKRLIDTAVDTFGGVDVLICNAGISMRALFDKVDLAVLHKLMDVNFWGCVNCTKYALPYIQKARGSIVGVSSVAGIHGLPGRTGYSASKYAMTGFWRRSVSRIARRACT